MDGTVAFVIHLFGELKEYHILWGKRRTHRKRRTLQIGRNMLKNIESPQP